MLSPPILMYKKVGCFGVYEEDMREVNEFDDEDMGTLRAYFSKCPDCKRNTLEKDWDGDYCHNNKCPSRDLGDIDSLF